MEASSGRPHACTCRSGFRGPRRLAEVEIGKLTPQTMQRPSDMRISVKVATRKRTRRCSEAVARSRSASAPPAWRSHRTRAHSCACTLGAGIRSDCRHGCCTTGRRRSFHFGSSPDPPRASRGGGAKARWQPALGTRGSGCSGSLAQNHDAGGRVGPHPVANTEPLRRSPRLAADHSGRRSGHHRHAHRRRRQILTWTSTSPTPGVHPPHAMASVLADRPRAFVPATA